MLLDDPNDTHVSKPKYPAPVKELLKEIAGVEDWDSANVGKYSVRQYMIMSQVYSAVNSKAVANEIQEGWIKRHLHILGEGQFEWNTLFSLITALNSFSG